MRNAPLSMCYGKSQIAVLITKHINMKKSIYDKIAHQQLKFSSLIVEETSQKVLKNIETRT